MWLLLVDTVGSSWNLRRRALANLVGSPLRSYSASDGKMGADNPGRKKAPPIPLFSFTSCAPLRLGSYSIIWKFPKIKVPPNHPFWSVFMDFPLTSTILGTSVFSNPPYCCIYLFDIIPRLSWETLRAAWMMRTRKTLPSWVNHDPFCSRFAMFCSACLTAGATRSLAVLVLRIYVLRESPGQQMAPETDSQSGSYHGDQYYHC